MTRADSGVITFAVWMYSLVLASLPRTVRQTVGPEMLHTFHMACRSAYERRRVTGVVRITLLALLDVARWIPREWRGAYRRRRASIGHHDFHPSRKDLLRSISTRELRYTLRFLSKHKGYAAIVILTLAIGIGANTTVFSLVNGVLFRASTLPDADRVVTIAEVNPSIDIPPRWASIPNYLDWKEQSQSFARVGMFRGRSMSVTGGDVPHYVYGAFITADFLPVMGVNPLLGRSLSEQEANNSEPVAVIGYKLWEIVSNADSGMVGRTISIDGIVRTVIGVMPRGFVSPGPWIGPRVQVDVWIPFTAMDDRRVNRSYNVVGRLADGVSLEDARSEMTVVQRRLADAYPVPNQGWQIVLTPWVDLVVGHVRLLLLLAWASAWLVLLMACVNVAGLTVNRTIARRGELTVRTALGAGRMRIVWQLLMEGLVMAGLGGVLGLGLAAVGLELIVSSNPGIIPLTEQIDLDLTVLAVILLSVVCVGVVVSLLAAARFSQTDLLADLATADRRHTPVGRLLKNGLAVIQLAITFVLLLGVGLLTRSLTHLASVEPGIETKNVFQTTVALSWNRITTLADRTRFISGVLDGLRALPGVQSAGMINSLPFSGSNAWQPIWLPGQPVAPAEEEPVVTQRNVSPDYFTTMGIPVLQGRDFVEVDVQNADVAIVNRTMAEKFWPEASPLGQNLAVNDASDTLTIVGVVGDVRHFGPRDDVPAELYQVYSRDFLTSKSFVVKVDAALNVEALGRQVRDVVYAQDPDQPIRDASPMSQAVRETMGAERFSMVMVGMASGIAVLLAGVGVFGVMANLVLERHRDIAVRLALGSSHRRMFNLILRTGFQLGVAGCAMGVIVSFSASRFMGRLLFEVSPNDVVTYVLVGIGVLVLSVTAGLLPARRASRIPLVDVLSGE